MRTNIEIDDELMKQAIVATGAKTKREAVEAALKMVVRIKNQEGFRRMRGTVVWEGNLDESREGRCADWS